MHAHTYTHYEHSVLTAEQRSHFRTRMLVQFLGMFGGATFIFGAVLFVSMVSAVAAIGVGFVGSVLFLRSLAQRAEDYMAVNDIYSASEH